MSEGALRVTLWVVAAIQVGLGLLGLLAPGTFFEEIGPYAPQNDHYIGDLGAYNVAAGFGVAMAAMRPEWRVPILVVGAVLNGLHALNHLFDVGEASSDAKGVFDTVALALLAVGSAYLAEVSSRLRREAPA
jgi:hypothetical protein